MHKTYLIPLAALFLVLPAIADGDAFKEEDALRAKQKAQAQTQAQKQAESSAQDLDEQLPVIKAKKPPVYLDQPFFSRADTEVPPLENDGEEEEESVHLTMTPEEAHDQYLIESRPAWYKRFPWGLLRGFANMTTCVGELGRGFTYSFGEYHPAISVPVGLVTGLAGTVGRCGAGIADVATLGLFGDRDLAENFPDYVWEGQWAYGFYPDNQGSPARTESAPAVAEKEDLGEGYVPSPTEKTPLKGRRAR